MVERNIPVAQATIDSNLQKGLLTQSQIKKYPNLRDGLAMFYAADETGNSKAARKARDAAYGEGTIHSLLDTPNEVQTVPALYSQKSAENEADFQKISDKTTFDYDDVNEILHKAENTAHSLTSVERALLEAVLNNPTTPLATVKRIKDALDKPEHKLTEADSNLLIKSTPVEREPANGEKNIDQKLDDTSKALAAASLIPGKDIKPSKICYGWNSTKVKRNNI